MTEADTGVRQLRAKECQGSIATMRSQEEAKKVSTQSLREKMVLLTP